MSVNYLLFSPSLLSERATSIQYKVENGNEEKSYQGMQTNEAVTKYLVDWLHGTGEKLEKIIMLCSKEVLENPLEVVGQRTTKEYFCGEITCFIEQKTGEKLRKDLFEVIPYYIGRNETVENLTKPLLEIIQATQHDTSGSKRLFVDFTGGTRNTALALVFACRILEDLGIAVEKILYSNISRGTAGGTIEECTATYNVFNQIETQIRMKYGDRKGVKKLVSKDKSLTEEEKAVIVKLLEQEDLIVESQEIYQMDAAMESAKNQKEELESKKTVIQSDLGKSIVQSIESHTDEMLQDEKNSELYYLKKQLDKQSDEGDKEALRFFRENIMNILWKENLIRVEERRYIEYDANQKQKGIKNGISEEFFAAWWYYNGHNQHGFFPLIKDYIDILKQNPKRSPKELYYNEIEKQRLCFENCYREADLYKHAFPHNDFSRRQVRSQVIEFTQTIMKEGAGVGDILDTYDKVDRIYMKYGFPFACTSAKYLYTGYDVLYKNCMKNGVSVIQKYYEGHPDNKLRECLMKRLGEVPDYEMFLEILSEPQNEDILRWIFPFQTKCMKAGRISQGEWTEFLYTFACDYDFIRQIRNNVSHPNEVEREKIKQGVQRIKNMVDYIESKKCSA